MTRIAYAGTKVGSYQKAHAEAVWNVQLPSGAPAVIVNSVNASGTALDPTSLTVTSDTAIAITLGSSDSGTVRIVGLPDNGDGITSGAATVDTSNGSQSPVPVVSDFGATLSSASSTTPPGDPLTPDHFGAGSTSFYLDSEFTDDRTSTILNGYDTGSPCSLITHGFCIWTLSTFSVLGDTPAYVSGTYYEATVTADGTAYPVAFFGSDVTSFTLLLASLSTQVPTCSFTLYGKYIAIRSNSVGGTSTVSISDAGLFSTLGYISNTVSGVESHTTLVWSDLLYSDNTPNTANSVSGGTGTLGGPVGDSSPIVSIAGEFVTAVGIFIEFSYTSTDPTVVMGIGFNFGYTNISVIVNESSLIRIDASGFNGYTNTDGTALPDPMDGSGITSASFTLDRYYTASTLNPLGKVIRAELTPDHINLYIDGVLTISQIPRFAVQLFATDFFFVGSSMTAWSTGNVSLSMFKSFANTAFSVDFVRCGGL